jgi:hypothetical protein
MTKEGRKKMRILAVMERRHCGRRGPLVGAPMYFVSAIIYSIRTIKWLENVY